MLSPIIKKKKKIHSLKQMAHSMSTGLAQYSSFSELLPVEYSVFKMAV